MLEKTRLAMRKIDSLMCRALRVYNELKLSRNDNSRRKELSELELEIQGLLQKEPTKPKPIMIHSRAKKPTHTEKLAYCFSNFPLKFNSVAGNESVSAFDMIGVIGYFMCDAQKYGRQKVLSVSNENIAGPELIHNNISKASSADIFVCEETEGIYRWRLYLPIVSSSEEWDYKQPDEDLAPNKFLIEQKLFKISGLVEIKYISTRRYGGTMWGRGEYRVYFGNLLVNEMERLRYLPSET
jgi:hypothetical protein